MTRIIAIIGGCALLLTAIGSHGADIGSAEQDRIAKSCEAQTNMGPALCRCVAGKAASELSSGGFRFLLASVEGDDATAASLRTQLPVQEMMQAGTFMTRAPAQCAKEGGAQ